MVYVELLARMCCFILKLEYVIGMYIVMYVGTCVCWTIGMYMLIKVPDDWMWD